MKESNVPRNTPFPPPHSSAGRLSCSADLPTCSIDVACQCVDRALLPTYASKYASGVDFRARLSEEKQLLPGEIVCIPTGICLAIPDGYELQIRPRSGLALNHGVTVLNSPGTIDSDYTGEIKVILIHHGTKPITLTPGMRIAQGVFAPIVRATFFFQEALEATTRGEGGFGHTGMH